MKRSCFLWMLLLVNIQLRAQTSTATGRILYEQVAGARVQYIEMWFSPGVYMYTTRNRPDDFLIKGKKYQSAEDSLKDAEENAKIALLINEGQPAQAWYGRMGDSMVLNTVSITGETVVTADTMSFVQWRIVSDTATVDGVLCQKATGVTPKGAKLTAWFAPGIPISVAPFTLRGLPGLLIRVTYDKNQAQTRTLQLEWPVKKEVAIEWPDKNKIVSKEERRAKIEKHNSTALQLLEYYRKQEKEKTRDNQ